MPADSIHHEVRRPVLMAFVALLAAAVGHVSDACAQQPLETETARLPAAHSLLVEAAYEYQHSPQGSEHAFPLAFEYGITNRLALLVEPVLYTSIRPKAARAATGVGDLESTLQWLVADESGARPALALGAEVKLPTASNRLIGTGRTDFTPYLIASKRLGSRYDLHANVGYSIVGKPVGIPVQNTLNLALALEMFVKPRLHVMGEVLSTTASTMGVGGESSATAPEIAGAETVGMLGARYALRPGFWLSGGVTYDNTNALLFRPGVTWELP